MVLRDGGYDPIYTLTAAAIEYAANNGARVINISSGFTTNYTVLAAAVNYAANTHDVIIVASTGNFPPGTSAIRYPAKYSNTIAVGATDENDSRRSYSCFGPEIDVVAPDGVPSTTMAGGYTNNVQGTSFSAPHVADLAALIRSVNPSLTWQQVRDILRNTADDKGPAGFDNEYGYGRINSLRAIGTAYVTNRPDYEFVYNNVSLSHYDNFHMVFLAGPNPCNASGTYYNTERHRLLIEVNRSFTHTPKAWYLGPVGYGWANPNNATSWFSQTVNSNTIRYETVFYRLNMGNFSCENRWAPFDPNARERAYAYLGRPMVAPVISHFTQTPIPICKGSSGYVCVNLSQGNGDLTYNWSYADKPSYVSVTFNGDCAYIINNYTGSRFASDPDPVPEAGLFTLYCTVSNSAGQSSSYFLPSVSTSCGCPTLAFEENGELINENPLLITSLSNPGADVTDYYLINTPMTPVNNQLKFVIHEPETEHTWFDQVSVIETRVNTNEYVAVTSDGEIVNYQRPVTPFQMTLNDSIDVTEMLADLDGNKISVESGDYITVTIIRGESGEEEDNMIMGGEEPGPPQKKIAGNVKFISNVNLERNKTAIDDNILQEGFTEDYGNFYFRPNLSIICNRLGNLPNGNLQISFNQAADLDYLVIAKNLRSARTRELEMLEAQHNIFGNIKNSLNQVDEIYGEIFPGERIDFTFAANEGQGRRAYILKTVGRYETDSAYIAGKVAGLQESQNNNIILENALFDNYPNPFNPATIISYSIKETGLVSVKVYDILGSVVATLVNESKPAGIYEVEFNASNLSSGVYFYSISVKDFHQVKKMLLIK